MALETPDKHYYTAAVGWMELGNPREALNELDNISAEGSQDPQVLELRWGIYSTLKEWKLALKTAEKLIEVAPDKPGGYVNRSYSLHELKRTREAYELLLMAEKKFPDVSIIAYNLACYSCQLNRLEEAMEWLKKALLLEQDKNKIKTMALADPDLQPLWDKIKLL